jgi:hypothetical protein
MNPSGKLAKLERLARLREPEASSRGAILLFSLVGLALGVYWAYGAITAGSGGIALNKLGLLFMALMFSAQFSGELLYPGTAGLLRVLARLVLLPAALAFFLAYLYHDFGANGFLVASFSCSAWRLSSGWRRASRAPPGSGAGRAAMTSAKPARTAPP